MKISETFGGPQGILLFYEEDTKMPIFIMTVMFFTLREPVRDIKSIFSVFKNYIHCQFKGTAIEPDRLQGLIWEGIFMSLEWCVNMRVIGLIEFKLFLLKRIHFFFLVRTQMVSIGIDVFSSLIQNLAGIRVWVRITNFHINPLSQAEFSMDTNR